MGEMCSPGRRFRNAVSEECPLQVVGVINAYAAIMAERVGFRAIYLSGSGGGECVIRSARFGHDNVK